MVLTDPVDEFWLPTVGKFKDHEFKSVTRGGADLAEITGDADNAAKADEPPAANIGDLVGLIKLTLGDAVKDVRTSDRLTESAVCLVADDGDLDMHLARLLRQHNQLKEEAKRVLELNPRHGLIHRLSDLLRTKGSSAVLEDAAWLLLDQARILEGEALPDPTSFARRLSHCLERGLV